MRAALLSSLMLFIVFVNCTPYYAYNVREQPTEKIIFEAEQNYQSVYRTIIDRLQMCYLPMPSVDVQGNLYEDIQKGRIQVMQGGYGIPIGLDIDIIAVNEHHSKVEAYYGRGFNASAPVLEKWVKEDYKKCRPDNW